MRVLIPHIPRSIVGHPTSFDGQCWMRDGESLEFMSPERLREQPNEASPSFPDENEPGERMWGEVMSPLAVERYYELIGARLPNEESRIRDFLRMHFVERAAFDPALFYVRRLGAVVLARSLRDFPDVEHHPIRVMRLRGGSITDMSLDRIYYRGYALSFSDAVEQIGPCCRPARRSGTASAAGIAIPRMWRYARSCPIPAFPRYRLTGSWTRSANATRASARR